MARISGPLLSLDARGNWAKGALQFRGGLQATHVYRPAPPGSVNQAPATEAQAPVRAAYQDALTEWRALTGPERAAWDASAQAQSLSGWNLYLKTRLPELLSAGQLPDPNTYVPPPGNTVNYPALVWTTDLPYTPPTCPLPYP